MTPALSDGIRDHYPGLSWKAHSGVTEAEAHAAMRKRVNEMIQQGSFLAPVT